LSNLKTKFKNTNYSFSYYRESTEQRNNVSSSKGKDLSSKYKRKKEERVDPSGTFLRTHTAC
jgi:hypothetical protein